MLTRLSPAALGGRLGAAALVAIACACAIGFGWSAPGRWTNRALEPLLIALQTRAASGDTVVVEMDAASVAAIRSWPWPRTHYAAVVDRLRRAGVGSITFDVDLSSPSTAAGDRALAASFARANGLVALPTFAQRAGSADDRSIDSLPLPMFRDHAALASVSMLPDDDGIVRHAPFGTVTRGEPRPSLSAYMASRSGTADSFFPINFGIDPGTLPRLSFVAVRDGRFDPAVVRGRDVIIGATAIEMGDRYATPYWGVIPGVVVQALAAETLGIGLPVEHSGLVLLGLAAVLGYLLLRTGRLAVALGGYLFAAVSLVTGAAVAGARWQHELPLAPALALTVLLALARIALHLAAGFDRQRCTDRPTGLPNRTALLRDPGAWRDRRVAVALIGNLDALLVVVGRAGEGDLVRRLSERMRIGTGCTGLYRLSERHLAFDLAPDTDCAALLPALRLLLIQPVEVAGRRVDASIHVGVADEGATLIDRINAATRAADLAAAEGTFWRHGGLDMAAVEREVSLMGELDQAIEAGGIEVHYQPKLSLAEDRITSVEALVRWRRADGTMIGPDLFIPLAEQSDRIAPLTLCVLRTALADLAEWQAAGVSLTVAVNVSARLVADETFGIAMRKLLADSGIAPACLILEVTESAAFADPEQAAAVLRQYRAMGCAVSMDDYGTGQSTLSYLQRLPLSELKIDRSFVQHAHCNEADGLMVFSTIDLAHRLGLKVVAEGIEDPECLAFLREAGCDMAQGYLISRPVPKRELLSLVEEQRAAA